MRVSRSVLYVNVAITRSTRSPVSAGSRAGVVTHESVTRFGFPNAKRANQRAISTSKPAFWLLAPMYPKGGVSHLTAICHRLRSLMFAGNGGSFALAWVGPASRADATAPQAAIAVPARAVTIRTVTSRLIRPLLLRRW
jgi:hypothetical protein